MRQDFFSRLVFCAALSGAAACFASQALAAPGCNTDGPGGGVWGVMQRQSQVMQMRQRSWSGTMRENDTSLGATCFDKAMALSSRLGGMFSDDPAKHILPPNMKIFMWDQRNQKVREDGIYNIFAGLGIKTDPKTGQPLPNTLSQVLAVSVVNTLDNYMGGTGNVVYPGITANNRPPPVPVAGMRRDDVNSGNIIHGNNVPTANYGGSLGGALGSTTTAQLAITVNGSTTYLTANITPQMINLVSGAQNSFKDISDKVATLHQWVGGALMMVNAAADIASAAGGLPDMGPIAALTEGVGEIYRALGEVMIVDQKVYQALNGVNGQGGIVNTYLAGYLDLNSGTLGGAATSMTGLSEADRKAGMAAPAGAGCNAMNHAWAGRPAGLPPDPSVYGPPDPNAPRTLPAVPGLVGSGPPAGMRYGSYADMFSGGPPDAGREMMDMVNNAQNDPTLWEATKDAALRMRKPPDPNDPEGLTSWKAPPADAAFAPTSTTGPTTPEDVIAQMKPY